MVITRLLFLVSLTTLLWAQAPGYTTSTLVHGATFQNGPLAPNTIATIFGINLSTATVGARIDSTDSALPFSLFAGGATVLVNGTRVPLYFVSPSQINFLVPPNLQSGEVRVTVVVNSVTGPEVRTRLNTAAPGLFVTPNGVPAATDGAGKPIAQDVPAVPGEWLVLYATGLGNTLLRQEPGQIARLPVPIVSDAGVWFGTRRVTPAYAGLAPGYAGLYQINVLVPQELEGASTVEVRLEIDGILSPPGVQLPLRKPN